MNLRFGFFGLALFFGLCLLPSPVGGQTQEGQTLSGAIEVLRGFTTFHAQSIPHSMLADAQAIAIIPNVIKGGFVIAGRFGRGVVLVREANGAWRAPTFVTFTGGSVGWQVGLQSSDVVLVFKNRNGLETMLSGREFTLGADASIAAGPVGRQASAGTDGKLDAEVYSYSRARGLFAGVALDGSVLKVDNRATASFYGNGQAIPPAAMQLIELVAKDTAGAAPANPAVIDPNTISTAQPPATADQLRQSLVEASRRLDPLVDENWRKFLALPPQVFASPPAGQPADQAELTAAVGRYDRVAQDPKYRALAERPEFRATHDLLRRYLAASTAAATPGPGLGQLPPPPAATSEKPAATQRRQ